MSDDQQHDDTPLVRVFSTAESSEGLAVKGRLESEGITTFVKGGATDQAFPTGGTFLFVKADDEAAAREILELADEGSLEELLPDEPEAQE